MKYWTESDYVFMTKIKAVYGKFFYFVSCWRKIRKYQEETTTSDQVSEQTDFELQKGERESRSLKETTVKNF